MIVKKVRWTEFNSAGYQLATENGAVGVDPKDFERTYEGEVIETYKPMIGSPRFVVAMPDGEIREVKMIACRVVEYKGSK